jgi:pimeloyl-ACP methyl ester carboxylesterase
MSDFRQYTASGAGLSVFINISLAAATTRAARLYLTPSGGSETLLAGGVTSIIDTGVAVSITPDLLSESNNPYTLRIEVSSNGGAYTTVATGDVFVIPSTALVSTDVTGVVQTDSIALGRLDRTGLLENARNNAKVAIEYNDSTFNSTDWSALTGVPAATNLQVSGNKLYSTSTTTTPTQAIALPRNVSLGEKFHITTFFDIVSFPMTYGIFFGLSMTDKATTTISGSYADEVMIGFTASGLIRKQVGSNTGAVSTVDSSVWTPSAGRYQVVWDGDESSISASIRHTTDTSKTFTWTWKTTDFTNGKTIGRLVCFLSDNRALSGQSMGPVGITLGSQQTHKTRTVAGMPVDNLAARDVMRYSTNGTDLWRLSLPTNYDPRRPAPLAIHFHPAQSSVATHERPWVMSQERGLSSALNDAGYIVATSQDGYNGTANSDRYANDTSLNEMAALINYVRTHYATAQTVFYGVSMGLVTATNLLARRTVANVNALYFIDGGLGLYSILISTDPVYSAYQGAIRNAYGIASDNSDAAQKLAGRDSMSRPWYDFRGIPMRLTSGDTDTLAPPSLHETFLQKVRPYVPEASHLTLSGPHADATHYVPSDLMTFLNTYIK